METIDSRTHVHPTAADSAAVQHALGRFGIWSAGLRTADVAEAADAAAEVESLGFGTVWLPGRGDGVFERAAALLAATESLVIATGIVSIWSAPATELAAARAALEAAYPGRFLLGIGISHAPIVDRAEPGRYRKPVSTMLAYLDELDAAGMRPSERILAALHPRMLGVAAERAVGAHPYLVSPRHTRWARERLGTGPVLAPEQSVVLESDPVKARGIARQHLNSPYITLPNYTRSWFQHGLEEADLRDGGSDRLMDTIVAWGDVGQVVSRVRAHHEAGADHVCLQVLDGDRTRLQREAWRALAAALEL
jgi:probable F420-dependent oxidoreductase